MSAKTKIITIWLAVVTLVFLPDRRVLGQQVPDFTIRFDQKAYLRINYTHNPAPCPLTLSSWNVLPTNENPQQVDTLAIGQSSRLLSVPVRTPQLGTWTVGMTTHELYLLPGDTVQITIDFLPTGKLATVIFTGPLAPYQHYLQQRQLEMSASQKRSFSMTTPTLRVLKRHLDSLDQQETQFLANYIKTHSLPGWFIQQMQLTDSYSQAAYRHNTVIYRRITRHETPQDVPPGFYTYLQRAPLPNPAAAHLTRYWDLVRDMVFLISGRQSGQPFSFEEELTIARRLLPAQDIDFFKARYLTLLATLDPNQALALLAKQEATIKNKKLVEVIRHYALSKVKLLRVGQPVPTFALPNLQDSLVSLRAYRGNLVVLCFWFPGCKPCVKEFPYENELVSQLADEPVRVVSIGTTSNWQTWQATIHRYDLRTFHLYANASWQRRLEQTYGIQGYPHYVLIDKEGQLIQNFAPRPSQGLVSLIRKYLVESESKK